VHKQSTTHWRSVFEHLATDDHFIVGPYLHALRAFPANEERSLDEVVALVAASVLESANDIHYGPSLTGGLPAVLDLFASLEITLRAVHPGDAYRYAEAQLRARGVDTGSKLGQVLVAGASAVVVASRSAELIRYYEGRLPGVFLSYAHHNQRLANAVDKQLVKALGTDRVFIDRRSIPPGVDWDHYLQVAFRSGDVVVALVTSEYLSSEWCKREFRLATNNGASVIPAISRRTPFPTGIPPFISRLQLLRYARINEIVVTAARRLAEVNGGTTP
jgi:hypothetical protein